MSQLTFITGNQNKVVQLSKYLGIQLKHQKIDLDELQTLDLKKVIEDKARKAFEIVQTPVIVEDVALEFQSLGRLPGTFIKFFIDEVPFETICRTLDNLKRDAIARCMFGYYDGVQFRAFEGSMIGSIAQHPAGENGYGWDKIFIPKGFNITRAQMSEEDYKTTYLIIKPIEKLHKFLSTMFYS